jgi:hypothetical protein|tara:strand:+ start:4359 stop:4946 length:588 start_codon:yes stop_codon:yes gene_type:complete
MTGAEIIGVISAFGRYIRFDFAFPVLVVSAFFLFFPSGIALVSPGWAAVFWSTFLFTLSWIAWRSVGHLLKRHAFMREARKRDLVWIKKRIPFVVKQIDDLHLRRAYPKDGREGLAAKVSSIYCKLDLYQITHPDFSLKGSDWDLHQHRDYLAQIQHVIEAGSLKSTRDAASKITVRLAEVGERGDKVEGHDEGL